MYAYVMQLAPRLERFKKAGSREIWNFRCPICHDSKHNRFKARGYIFNSKGVYRFYCHNCLYACTFEKFLKKVAPDIHQIYLMDKFKSPSDVNFTQGFVPPKDKGSVDLRLMDSLMDRLDRLPTDHIAVRYAKDRQLPEWTFEQLYYIDDFSKIGQMNPAYADRLKGCEERLVIPAFDRGGKLIGLTGRALAKTKQVAKYISVQINEDKPLVYGVDRVNLNRTIYVMEGPLDSFFLPNAIATGSSFLLKGLDTIAAKERFVLVPDAQPRNEELVRSIGKFITEGYRIALLPDRGCKDINDFILNGILPDEIIALIKSSTVQGLEAELALQKWKKI